LWLALTVIWWVALVAGLLSAGVAFEVPDDLARWIAARNTLDEEKCHQDPGPPECWQAIFQDEPTSTPGFIFASFQERGALAAVFIVPPVLVYGLGSALFWVFCPLADGRNR
jgi:hypothetical protein